jgi:hypothetical protein
MGIEQGLGIQHVTAGTNIHIGQPSNCPPDDWIKSMAELAGSIPGVVEAHLPLCLIEGLTDEPILIFFVVVSVAFAIGPVLHATGTGIESLASPGPPCRIVAMRLDDPLLPAIRSAGCLVFDDL